MTADLRVVTYHRVLPAALAGDDPLVSATPEGFARQMARLARAFRVVSLDAVLAAQRGSVPLPSRALLVTFDDASPDFAEWAAPLLSRLGVPATVFVPTAYPGGGLGPFWWDRVRAAVETSDRPWVSTPNGVRLPLSGRPDRRRAHRALVGHIKTLPDEEIEGIVADLLVHLDVAAPIAPATLGWEELRTLARRGVTVAAHTRTHPLLTKIDASRLEQEIAGSLADVRREMGSTLPALCYPAGAHDERVVAAARACGVELAFTCRDGINRMPSADPLRLCRTNVTRRTGSALLQLRLHPLGVHLDRWRHRPRRKDLSRPPVEAASTPRVAYLVSRFPKVSETFVLNEMRAVEEAGIGVELFPLRREHQPAVHPEAVAWDRRARHQRLLSADVLRANLAMLFERPVAYGAALAEALRGTWPSPRHFPGAVVFFPKAVWIGYEARRLGISHLHAHFATHPTLVALVAHRLSGIPFSFTAHGSDLHVDRRMLPEKVRAAAFVVAVSRYNREVILSACEGGAEERVRVLHCGADLALYRPPPGRLQREAIEIVSIASLEQVKGHRFLLDACGLLRDRGMKFRCRLVGSGPLEREIRAQRSRLELLDEIVIDGPRTRPEVQRILAAADIAVLASHPTPDGRREGIPVALMEAMAMELPVVATRISGIPELVTDGETGILVPSGDPSALAGALGRLAADPGLRIRLGRAARARVLEEFDAARSASRLAEWFRGPGQSAPEGREAAVRAEPVAAW